MKNNYKKSSLFYLLLIVLAGSGGLQAQTTIFQPTDVPASYDTLTAPVTLGMKFRSSYNGYIKAIRFYNVPSNIGPHVGNIWKLDRTNLAQVHWTYPTPGSGWQQAQLTSPVYIQADSTYIVSYFAPYGNYSYDTSYFITKKTNGDLTALAWDYHGPDGANGVYFYNPGTSYPSTPSGNKANYWVDVVYERQQESFFPNTVVPANLDANENTGVNLGVKFQATDNGTVTGVRFFKGVNDTGVHVGSLWSVNGTLIRQVTFTNETASGWQTQSFADPARIKAGQTYIVSFHSPYGRYGYQTGYFTKDTTRGHLTFLKGDVFAPNGGNGVYLYNSNVLFPSVQSGNQANYFVDLVYSKGYFGDNTPPTIPGNVTATAVSNSRINLSWTASTDNSGHLGGYEITRIGDPLPIAFVQTTSYIDSNLASGFTYQYKVRAVDTLENFSNYSPIASATTIGGAGANRAFRFDGVDDYLAIYNGNNLRFFDFTFETWVKAAPGVAPGTIYGNESTFFIKLSHNAIATQISAGREGSATILDRDGADFDNTKDWIYYAIVRKGDSLHLWRNGQLKGSKKLAMTLADTAMLLGAGIGGIMGGPDNVAINHFNGWIDEIRISKVARDSNEIKANWNAGAGKFLYADSVTSALWHFNEPEGEIAYDYSKGGNEAVLKPNFSTGNTPARTPGFYFSQRADFAVYLPDFTSRIGARPMVMPTSVANTDQLTVYFNGTVIHSQAAPLPKLVRFPVNLRTLSQGNHSLVVRLTDVNGNTIKSDTNVFYKPLNGIPHVSIDEFNAVCLDGVRMPWQFSPWLPDRNILDSTNNRWYQHTPMAINSLHGKGFLPDNTQPGGSRPEYIDDYLDWAWNEHQFYCIEGAAGEMPKVVENIHKIKNKPGLLLYSWLDEPDLNGKSADEVRSWVDTTHKLDPSRPVLMNYQGASAVRTDNVIWKWITRKYAFPTFAGDMLMFDYYPIAEMKSAGITRKKSFENLSGVADNFRAWSYDQVPRWGFVQPHIYDETSSSARPPTKDELRLNYWLLLIHGVTGISWFDKQIGATDSAHEVMSELVDKTQRLADVLFTYDVEDLVTKHEQNGGRVDIMTKVHNGKIYIFAANVSDAPETVTFTFSDIPGGAVAKLFDTTTTIPISGGSFTDSFDSVATKIYVIDQEAPALEFAKTTFLLPEKEFDGIIAAPNPFGNAVNISIGRGITVHAIEVYDSNGKRVKSFNKLSKEGSNLNLPFGGIAPGTYIFRFLTNQGVKVKKLIKN